MSVFGQLSNNNSYKILDLVQQICTHLDRYIDVIKNQETKVPGDTLGRTYAEVLRSTLEAEIRKIENFVTDNEELFNSDNEFSKNFN